MEKIKEGEKLQIQCYKHDGNIHRAWDEAVVIDIKEDYIVCGNKRTEVIESSGKTWKTREPAVIYFFKDRWFNIIAQLKKDGLYFYCNIATPYIIEEKTIKYIDYDLDLRIFPDGKYKILDRLEFDYHKKKMNYPKDLEKVINNGLDELIKLYNSNSEIFDKNTIYKYNKKYQKLTK